MDISYSETVPVYGYCPVTNKAETIDVTYKSFQPLGSNETYALITDVYCPYIDSCTVHPCPIASQRELW